MRIKRLRLTGFKSFVDPADLRIEPGLTGVVGPNGCGKSNLLEALRWTMGENSARSMRGAGMEDVIFAGTASRPPRDFAEVALLAERDGPDGGAAGPIARRALCRTWRRGPLPLTASRRPPLPTPCKEHRALSFILKCFNPDQVSKTLKHLTGTTLRETV